MLPGCSFSPPRTDLVTLIIHGFIEATAKRRERAVSGPQHCCIPWRCSISATDHSAVGAKWMFAVLGTVPLGARGASRAPPRTPPAHMARGGGALPQGARAPQPPTNKRFSVDAGVDVVSRYIARGVAFANAPSYQPYATVGVVFPQLTHATVKDVKLSIGNWNSFQGGRPGLGQADYGSVQGWYESDLYAAVAVTFARGWSSSFAYYFFHSPEHSFDNYGDLEWSVSYDDSQRWRGVVPLRKFALRPHLRVTRDVGRPHGSTALYVEPSLTPSFAVGTADFPVRIGFPLAIGLSDTYYTGIHGGHPHFGFFRTGVNAVARVARTAGYSWNLRVGVSVWIPNHEVTSGLGAADAVAWIGTSVIY